MRLEVELNSVLNLPNVRTCQGIRHLPNHELADASQINQLLMEN